LILAPILVFGYTVVRKDGKVFSGELIQETAEEVILKDQEGITLKFRRNQIDWNQTTIERKKEEKKEPVVSRQTIEIRKKKKESKWVGEPINIDFKDIDVRDLFRFLAETGNMNLIIDPSVRGTISIKMTAVPWDHVLDLVCRQQGLGYALEGNVVSIED